MAGSHLKISRRQRSTVILRLELTNRYLEYEVNQYNITMDVLGGCSREVEQIIKDLVGEKCESLCAKCKRQSCLVHYTLLECSS